jgi:hypothetical protein
MKTHLRSLSAAASLAVLAFVTPTTGKEASLSGRWVMVQLTTTVADLPVIGDIYATSRLVTLHDLEHDGRRLRGGGVICQLELDSGSSLVDTELSEGFKRALPEPYIDARVRRADGRVRFTQARQWIVVGAELDNPKTDALPLDEDDERVRDQDGDGRPGVTIEVSGIVDGEIYAAQRTWTRLSGLKRVDGSFRGRVYFGNEQSILGATSSMLESAPETTPLPKRSWFVLLPVSDGTGCEEARDIAARFFES